MKGLLIKDLNLMRIQKKFFIIVFAMAIVMSISTNDNSFILGYMTFVIPIFALNTMSYDELDNGYAFLFTLPISRKKYVHEKYCFSLLLGAASLVLAVILSVVLGLMKKSSISDTLAATPFILGIMIVLLAIMIPIQFKFGAENSRIALIAFFGITAALGFGVLQILKLFDIDLLSFLNKLIELNFGITVAIIAIIAAVFTMLSIRISIAIMNKKEY